MTGVNNHGSTLFCTKLHCNYTEFRVQGLGVHVSGLGVF